MAKYGIFSWFGFVMPLSERLELIKKAGFDSTCLWWEDEEGAYPVKKTDMPKMVRDFGLSLEISIRPFAIPMICGVSPFRPGLES